MDEISNLAEQRNRMMQAMAVLEMPESIGKRAYVNELVQIIAYSN